MQIGKIVEDSEEQKKYSWHPHSIESRVAEKSNLMFVARDKLTFNETLPGAGVLTFREDKC